MNKKRRGKGESGGEKTCLTLPTPGEGGFLCVSLYGHHSEMADARTQEKGGETREREIELEALPLLSGLYGDPSTGDERKHRNGGLQPTRSKFNSGRLAPQVFR